MLGMNQCTAESVFRGQEHPACAGVNPPTVLHGKNATLGSERGSHHDGCARLGRGQSRSTGHAKPQR